MNDLIQAIEDRRQRAIGVKATYSHIGVGSNCFVVTHPDEPERSYLVDMTKRTCNCADFTCFAAGHEIDCKHLVAVAEGEGIALPPRSVNSPYWDTVAVKTTEYYDACRARCSGCWLCKEIGPSAARTTRCLHHKIVSSSAFSGRKSTKWPSIGDVDVCPIGQPLRAPPDPGDIAFSKSMAELGRTEDVWGD